MENKTFENIGFQNWHKASNFGAGNKSIIEPSAQLILIFSALERIKRQI